MSDPFPHSSPEADPPRGGGLPTRRSETEVPSSEESAELPQQISLDEMMERLQRSGTAGSSSSSGRRRRSSSSSSGSSSERRPSHRQSGHSADREDDRDRFTDSPTQDLPRAVLPPPRHRHTERSIPERAPRAVTAAPRRRPGWYILAGLVLLGLGAWFGVRLLNRWRIEGEGFRVNVGRRLSELADRRVSTGRFRQTAGNQLNTGTLAIEPGLRDLLAAASFANVTADFTAVSSLSDDWAVRSLRVQQGNLTFQPVKTLDEQSMMALRPAPVDRGASPRGGFRMGMTADPATVEIETGRFDELNLSWPGPDGKPETLSGMQASFRTLDQTTQIEVAGGLLDTVAWPPFPVRQIQAKLRGTALEIISARLGFTAEHEVRVSGSAQLTPEGRLQLKAEVGAISLKHLLPHHWSSVALGSFSAEAATWSSTFKPGGPEASFSGPFQVKGFVLRGLPFVEKIANLLRKPELALMEFPTLAGQFQWTPSATRLTELSAITGDGLLRLKGSASALPNGEISVQWVVEANEAYFAGLPADQLNLFTPGPEGWRSLAFAVTSRDGIISDSIGISQPALIESRPVPTSLEAPRMSLPPGVAAPSASPAPRPPVMMVPPPALRPAAVPPPSDAELERQFKELLGR